jgi:hypothetical protein
MKRDDVVLPIEQDEKTEWVNDPVQEGMRHYYNRDPEALRRLLEQLVKEKK